MLLTEILDAKHDYATAFIGYISWVCVRRHNIWRANGAKRYKINKMVLNKQNMKNLISSNKCSGMHSVNNILIIDLLLSTQTLVKK